MSAGLATRDVMIWRAQSAYAASSNLMMIVNIVFVLLLHDGGLIVAASAAVEGKRHQDAADHQSEYDADTQERMAPVGQINVAQCAVHP